MRAIVGAAIGISVAVAVGPVRAQESVDRAAVQSVIGQWLGLVRDGAWQQAWDQASPFFQYRITAGDWRDWVRAANAELTAGSPRREVEFTVGHDEPPLVPLTWVRAVYARDRVAGGRVIEQIVVLDDGGRWRVAHYGAWTDQDAIGHGGSLYSIPYFLPYRGQYSFTEFPFSWRAAGAPIPAQPVAPRPINIANPATFPKRPPPR